MDALVELRKMRNRIVDNLEQQQRALDAITKAIQQLEGRQTTLDIEPKSDKYTGKGLSFSILKLLDEQYPSFLSPKNIVEKLLEGGYQSKAVNFSNSVRGTLYHLNKKGSVEYEKGTNGNTYRRKKKYD